MKYIFSFIAILLVFIGSDLIAQPFIGVHAGTNSMSVSGNIPSKTKFKSSGGFQFGVSADFTIAKDVLISFQPGVIKSETNLQFLDVNTDLYEDSVGFDFTYFELPIEIQIMSKNKRFYFSSGLEFSALMKAESTIESETEDISEDLNQFNIFMNYGLTYLIPVGKPSLFIEGRYSQGLINMTNTPDEDSYIPRIKLSGWKFRAGIRIPLKSDD